MATIIRSEERDFQPNPNKIFRFSQKFQWGNNKIVIPREGNLIGSDEQIATMPDRGDLPLFMGGG